MYRTRLSIVAISLLILPSCQAAPEPAPKPTPKPETRAAAPPSAVPPTDAWFGYIDETGSRVLMLPGDTAAGDEQAKAIRTAICSDARELVLRYVGFQKATAETNSRQNAANLKNDEGHLFAVERAAAQPGDTCLLLPSGYLQQYPLVHNEYSLTERRRLREEYRRAGNSAAVDLAPFQPRDDFARATVQRIEREKRRKVRLYWLLHRAGVAQQVAIVEFEPDGDSLLASLVMADAERLSFLDMPAERTGKGSCWRVDDGCRVNQAEMDVPVVLGRPDEALVFYTAGGPEGQSIRLLQVGDGALTEVKSAYRYQAPR